MVGKTSAEKLAHVKAIAIDAATAANAQAGREVVNVAAVTATAEGAITTAVNAVNIVNKTTAE